MCLERRAMSMKLIIIGVTIGIVSFFCFPHGPHLHSTFEEASDCVIALLLFYGYGQMKYEEGQRHGTKNH